MLIAQGRNNLGLFETQKEVSSVNKLWYIHIMKYYTAVKNEKALYKLIWSHFQDTLFPEHSLDVGVSSCQGTAEECL